MGREGERKRGRHERREKAPAFWKRWESDPLTHNPSGQELQPDRANWVSWSVEGQSADQEALYEYLLIISSYGINFLKL